MLSLVLLIITALMGWYAAGCVYKERGKSYRINRIDLCYKKETQNIILLISWFLFFVSVVSYYIYSRAYGGFGGALLFSKFIRAGILLIDNPYSWLRKIGTLSFVSSFLFYSILIDGNKSISKKMPFVGLIISFVFSIYVLFDLQGRVGFASYLLVFYLSYLMFKRKGLNLLLFSSLGFFLMALVIWFTSSFVGKASDSIFSFFINELSFPIASFITSISSNIDFRLFKDILFMPLFMLPQKIWSGVLNITTASEANTILMVGAGKGSFGITGEIPTDLLTFSYMQASFLGVAIIGILIGLLLFYLERMLENINIASLRSVIRTIIVLQIIILMPMYGDLENIISRVFNLIVALLCLYIFRKKLFEAGPFVKDTLLFRDDVQRSMKNSKMENR